MKILNIPSEASTQKWGFVQFSKFSNSRQRKRQELPLAKKHKGTDGMISGKYGSLELAVGRNPMTYGSKKSSQKKSNIERICYHRDERLMFEGSQNISHVDLQDISEAISDVLITIWSKFEKYDFSVREMRQLKKLKIQNTTQRLKCNLKFETQSFHIE